MTQPERRRSPRVQVRRLKVLYHPPADPHDILHTQPSRKGVAADLSEHGMRVLLLHPMDAGTRLHLTLEVEVPQLRQKEVVVKGHVVRCRELAQGEHELGISLTTVGADFTELVAHLRTHPLLRLGGI